MFQAQYKAMGVFHSVITCLINGEELAIEIRTDDSQQAFYLPKDIILQIAAAIKEGTL
jgi:hypothetical protein